MFTFDLSNKETQPFTTDNLIDKIMFQIHAWEGKLTGIYQNETYLWVNLHGLQIVIRNFHINCHVLVFLIGLFRSTTGYIYFLA